MSLLVDLHEYTINVHNENYTRIELESDSYLV